jgi:hypothetical protein
LGYDRSLKSGEKIMKPIRLEIVTKVVTFFDTCRRCQVIFGQAGLDKKIHQKEMEEYPLDLKEEYMRLSEWIRELSRLYKHRLRIKLIDVQSPLGVYKSLRHRIRTYPGFIVEGKETYIGWDKSQLESLLDKYIQKALPSKQGSLQASPS